MRILIKILVLKFLLNSINVNGQVITGVGNFLLYPSITNQTEPVVVKHPFNQNLIFVSANAVNFNPFFISEGVYVSTNGGLSWIGSDTCKGEYINFHGGDPAITIDKNGNFILNRLGRTPFAGLFSHISTDNGRTWSFQKLITDHDLERSSIVSDVNPSSPFFGRIYTCWVRFAPPYPVYFSYSEDGGLTWSIPRQVNLPPQRCAGGEIILGLNGEIVIVYALVSSASPFYEQFVGLAKSFDGGANWIVNDKVFPVKGVQGILPEKQSIRINGLPRITMDYTNGPRKGWIYIVTTQKNLAPAGEDPDIILYRSTDGGNTWSNGIRVNQDQFNNGKIQYFPAISVDDFGDINIIYYDDRNTTSDSTGVFLSRSTDGGETFTDYEISDKNFMPIPIGGLGQGYQGDLIAVTSVDNYLIPIWMDNRTGNYQLWYSRIDLNNLTKIEDVILPNNFEVSQNYPNPFNSETLIEIKGHIGENVDIDIFNLFGEKIYSRKVKLSQGGLEKIKITFHSDKPSGIYFYSVRNENKSIVKKMIYLK